jgi:2-polyprenyl-3-methyl-5-hydroxy-6-metoxy-1,4-benzoquinol methylase
MIQSTELYDNSGNQQVLSAIPQNAQNILDLGCGAANVGKSSNKNSVIWDGVTISESEASIAKKYYQEVYVHNLESGLPAETLNRPYDTCVASHVIEHIVWPSRLLKDIHNVLSKSNGTLIVALPNALHHEVRMKLLRGKFVYKESGIMDINHVRWYTYKSAQQLLTDNGFRITKSWVEGTFPISKKTRKHIPIGILKKLDNFACKTYPGLFGFQMIFVAKPI